MQAHPITHLPSLLIRFRRLEICDDPSSSRITATLELPGMKSDEIRVHLDKNDVLLISGERRSRMPSDQESDVRYLAKEIKYGRFERALRVPKGTMVSPFSDSFFLSILCGYKHTFP